MEAQIAAAQIGAQRFIDLVRRYGRPTVVGASEDLMDYSERLMRAAISRIPDGVYTATTHIDGYLDDPEPSRRDLPIVVTITVEGDEMTVDLAGTAPQVPDRPINMPFEGTVDCAVWLTLRSILLDSAVFGSIPQNSGLTRPIRIIAPKGCLANPVFPAPVIARFCPGNAVADAVMKSLAPAVPNQISAGIGNLTVIAFSGTANNQQWVHMEILEGSYGGRHGMDGMDAVDTLYANTRNNPIEDIESHLPLRVNRYELRENLIAAGEWRGGIGSVREFAYLTDGGFSVEGDGHKFKPWGFAGGAEGSPSALLQVAASGETIELPSKVPYRNAKAGDRLVAYGPSGGGYGDPLARSPESVLSNVIDGLLSDDLARRQYGVVIVGNQVDLNATNALRARMRGYERSADGLPFDSLA
jgi:N-methylhydantoinase B